MDLCRQVGSYELQLKIRNKENGQKVEHRSGGCPASRVCDQRGHWRHKLPMPLCWGHPPTHRIYPDCSRLAAWDPKFGAALRAGIQCSVLRIWATNQEERELVSKEEGDDMFVKWSAGKSGIACCGILIVVLSFTPWTGWANPGSGAGVKWASNSLACQKSPGCWTYHPLELNVQHNILLSVAYQLLQFSQMGW